MSTEAEIQAELSVAEDRAVNLHEQWLRAENLAAFHERRDHSDADSFRRRADEWKAGYETAVRDLRRLQVAAKPGAGR